MADPAVSTDRYPGVDAIRGLAVVNMVAYHACWFASDARLVTIDFSAPAWRAWQRGIAGTFFLLVGVGLHLASVHGAGLRPFAARCARLLACAAVVTATSVVLDPGRIVTFGVLHCILATSLLTWPLRALGPRALVLAAVALALAAVPGIQEFDSPRLAWLGLGLSHAPTFDFQPLFPWLGVVLLGLGVAGLLPRALLSFRPPGSRLLAVLGQHSLFVYMAHVPVLMAVSETMTWCTKQSG